MRISRHIPALAILLANLAWTAPAEKVFPFVDDAVVAARRGVVRQTHAGKKLPKPVLEPDRPWEGLRTYIYGTVHYDAPSRQFRMWYMSRLGPGQKQRAPGTRTEHGDFVNYATSNDGVHWTKPELGIQEFDGSTKNNIVFDLHSPSVIADESEPDPAYRYKMAGVGGPTRKYWAAYSADGLHWKDYPKNPILDSSDTITATRDPSTGVYFAFHKRNPEIRGFRRRTVWLSTSRDFQNWSEPALILAPDEIDDRWVAKPVHRTEFYDMSGFPYAGQFLGLLAVFRVTAENRNVQLMGGEKPSPVDGPIEIQLAHSRDGKTWQRADDRSPLIPVGPPGAFDGGCILGIANPIVLYNDEMWVYYTAVTTGHGGALPQKRMSIGRASWRLDGFVSLDAGAAGGTIETKPLAAAGGKLSINAEASRGGIVVEVLDQAGKPLAGYGRADSIPIRGDAVRQPVRWKTKTTLPDAADVRLRIYLKNSKLYSLRIQ